MYHKKKWNQDSFATPDNIGSGNGQESTFSPLAAPFQSRMDNEFLSMMSQQEPRPADTGYLYFYTNVIKRKSLFVCLDAKISVTTGRIYFVCFVWMYKSYILQKCYRPHDITI